MKAHLRKKTPEQQAQEFIESEEFQNSIKALMEKEPDLSEEQAKDILMEMFYYTILRASEKT